MELLNHLKYPKGTVQWKKGKQRQKETHGEVEDVKPSSTYDWNSMESENITPKAATISQS